MGTAQMLKRIDYVKGVISCQAMSHLITALLYTMGELEHVGHKDESHQGVMREGRAIAWTSGVDDTIRQFHQQLEGLESCKMKRR